MADNSHSSSAQSKHIDVRFYFVQELLRSESIDDTFAASEEQHAGILTKTLAAVFVSMSS